MHINGRLSSIAIADGSSTFWALCLEVSLLIAVPASSGVWFVVVSHTNKHQRFRNFVFGGVVVVVV